MEIEFSVQHKKTRKRKSSWYGRFGQAIWQTLTFKLKRGMSSIVVRGTLLSAKVWVSWYRALMLVHCDYVRTVFVWVCKQYLTPYVTVSVQVITLQWCCLANNYYCNNTYSWEAGCGKLFSSFDCLMKVDDVMFVFLEGINRSGNTILQIFKVI